MGTGDIRVADFEGEEMTLNEAQCAVLLAENKTRLAENKLWPWSSRDTVLRYWPEIRREDLDACMVFLKKYCSVKNYTASTASQTVTDPVIELKNDRTGTYRQVWIGLLKDQDGKLDLYQLLRAENAGWQMLFASERTAFESTDTRVYRRTSGKVDAPEHTQGSIYRTENTINEDDATYDAKLMYLLARAASVTFASERTAFRKEDAILYRNITTAVDAPEVTGSGMYRAQNAENDFGLYDSSLIYDCGTGAGEALFGAQRSVLADEDRGIYRDRLTQVEAPVSGAGGIYEATNTLTDRGTYDSGLAYSTGKAASAIFASMRTAFKSRTTGIYLNRNDQIEAPAIAGSGMYRADNSINRYGLYDSGLIYDCGTNAGQVEFAAMRGYLEDSDRAIYRDRTSKIDAPPADPGGIYEADNSLTDDGLYNSGLAYSTGKTREHALFTRRTATVDRLGHMYRNSAGVIAAPGPVTGGIYEAESTLNRFGTYDAGLVYQSGKERFTQVVVETLSASQGNTYASIYENTATVPTAENSARNIYRKDFRPNEMGLYDGTLTHEQRTSIEAGPFVTLRTDQETENMYMYENRDAVVDVPSGSKGSGVWGRNREDDTYNGQLRIREDLPSYSWWGGTGEWCFWYITTIGGELYNMYVYDKYTRSQTSATSHINTNLGGDYRNIGQNDGHVTDITPIGMGRLRARRLELLTTPIS